jgi:hypothetical protein
MITCRTFSNLEKEDCAIYLRIKETNNFTKGVVAEWEGWITHYPMDLGVCGSNHETEIFSF